MHGIHSHRHLCVKIRFWFSTGSLATATIRITHSATCRFDKDVPVQRSVTYYRQRNPFKPVQRSTTVVPNCHSRRKPVVVTPGPVKQYYYTLYSEGITILPSYYVDAYVQKPLSDKCSTEFLYTYHLSELPVVLFFR